MLTGFGFYVPFTVPSSPSSDVSLGYLLSFSAQQIFQQKKLDFKEILVFHSSLSVCVSVVVLLPLVSGAPPSPKNYHHHQ